MDPTSPGPTWCKILQGLGFFLPPRDSISSLCYPSPQPPPSTLSARAAPCSPPRSPTQLQLESSWCGSTLPSHDFSVLSLGLGLPFLAAMTGRVALPVVHRAMGASPATNIRQGYACLFPSLPFPSRCTKSNTQIPNVRYLFSDLTMILPTKFDLFATVVFVFGSDHDFTC